MLISYLFILVSVLLGLGFFTLLERKVLGYLQERKGPSKVGYLGLLQPVGDGLKLFLKESVKPKYGDAGIFLISPILGLGLCFLSWGLYVNIYDVMDFEMGLLFYLCVSGVGVYVLMFAGWGSSSSYGMVGCYRAVAQTISYEVSSAFVLLSGVMVVGGYGLGEFMSGGVSLVWLLSPLVMVWYSVLLAETNRSPYDFAEGESELVSGYNVEYSSGPFSLLFSGEYGNILVSCYLSGVVFMKAGWWVIILVIGVIWIRGSFPRFRYDKLMSSAWKGYLGVSLGYFMVVGGIMSLVK